MEPNDSRNHVTENHVLNETLPPGVPATLHAADPDEITEAIAELCRLEMTAPIIMMVSHTIDTLEQRTMCHLDALSSDGAYIELRIVGGKGGSAAQVAGLHAENADERIPITNTDTAYLSNDGPAEFISFAAGPFRRITFRGADPGSTAAWERALTAALLLATRAAED